LKYAGVCAFKNSEVIREDWSHSRKLWKKNREPNYGTRSILLVTSLQM